MFEKNKDFERIQNKIRDVMGPLSQVWGKIETFRKSEFENPMDIDEVADLLQKSVILLGQASNSVSYQRRMEVLKCFTDQKSAKAMIVKQAETLSKEPTDLFGKEFKTVLRRSDVDSKKALEYFKNESPKKQPFRGGSFSKNKERGKERPVFFRKNRGHHTQSRGNFSGMYDSSTEHVGKSKSPAEHAGTCTDKKFICRNKIRQPFCRKIKKFSAKLGKINKRQKHHKHSERMGNTSTFKTNPTKTTSQNSIFKSRRPSSGLGSIQHVEKRSNKNCYSKRGPIVEQYFCTSKKRRRIQTNNQPERVESICALPTFQNGGTTRRQKYAQQRRPHVQIRSQGCIFYGSPGNKVPETSEISLERETIRVPMPSFRTGPSTQDIHKIAESPNFNTQKIKHANNNLFRRHVNNGVELSGNLLGTGHNYLPFPTSGANDKLGKIHSDTPNNNRISGSKDRQHVHDTIFAREQSEGLNLSLPTDVDFSTNNTQAISIFNWKIERYSPSNNSSSAAITFSSTTAYKSTTTESIISNFDISGPRLCHGTKMVGNKLTHVKRETPPYCPTTNGNLFRCSHIRGMGSCLTGPINWGDMDSGGKPTSHQHIRIDGCRTGYQNIYKGHRSVHNPYPDRQHSSFILSDKNGGNQESKIDRNIKKDMGLSACKRDHSYIRMDPHIYEYSSRLRIEKCKRLERMETKPRHFSETNSEMGKPTNRPICFQNITPTTTICEPEGRPELCQSRCFSNDLGGSFPLCFSPFLPHTENSQKSVQRASTENDYNNTTLVNPAMVPSNSEYGNTEPSLTSNELENFTQPTRRKPPTYTKFHHETSGLDDFRKSLFAEGISRGASQLIACARREGTRSNYEAAWKKWSMWCSERNMDPLRCSLTYILDFLTELFTKKLAYRTIGVYRSAISAYHTPVEGISIGKHPRVSALMTGIANLNPPQPKYSTIWDLEDVLNQLRTWPRNELLSPKQLTLKLVMLLAIIAVNRGSEIHKLNIKFKGITKDKAVFSFGTTVKHFRRGKKTPPIEFYAMPSEPNLCPILTLNCYLDLSKDWRKSDAESQLFLSFVNPHKAVTKSTITRWIKEVLKLSGIDINTYQAHSVRAASTSKTKSRGLSTNDILKMGNWSQESTWQKFYNKNIVTPAKRFQDSLFSNN